MIIALTHAGRVCDTLLVSANSVKSAKFI